MKRDGVLNNYLMSHMILSEYENRKKLMIINVKTFNVPGNYPKLESKIPNGGFQNKNHRNMYNKLWGRNN